MLGVIITDNISRGYITLDFSTCNLVLQSDLSKATFFNLKLEEDISLVLKKARQSFKGYLFRVVYLDESLVDPNNIVSESLDKDNFNLTMQ